MRMNFLDAHNLTSKCSRLTQETKFTEKEVIEINSDSKDKISKIELYDDGEFSNIEPYDFWNYSDQSWLRDGMFSGSRIPITLGFDSGFGITQKPQSRS